MPEPADGDLAGHGDGGRIALLGMHAQYEHSPPTSSRSTAATVNPAAPARSATVCPIGPVPITITSYAFCADGPLTIRLLSCWAG